MDFKIEIKEEDPFSDDVASDKERELFCNVGIKRNSTGVLLDNDCDKAFKTEIKSEFPFTKHVAKQIRSETATCTNNWEIDRITKIEKETVVSAFGSQYEGDFLSEAPLMKAKKYGNVEMDNKLEIKEEPCWVETQTSFVCDEIKDGDFSVVKSLRLCTEAVSGASSSKTALPSAEVSGRDSSFDNGKNYLDHELRKTDVTEIPTAEKQVFSEQSSKCNDGKEMYTRPLLSQEQKSLNHKGKGSHKCNICGKAFDWLSNLKRHNMSHEGTKPHQCKTCDKSFTRLSSLKTHNLIHEGKKPHQCKTCNKSFTQVAHLKTHILIHEGKKSQDKIWMDLFS